MLRRRTDVPPLADDDRGAPADPAAADVHRCRAAGAARRLGRVAGPRGRAPPTRRGVRRSRHHRGWSLTARDREILLACAAGAGLGAVYSVPLGGALFAARILLGTWHPRALGTALDHVEPRGRGGLARHPPRAPADVAGRADCPICSSFLALAIAPLAVAVGLGVRQGDGAAPARSRRSARGC